MPWLEKHIEKNFVDWIEEFYTEWYAIKINKRGWPDRLILGPGPTVFFIEFKLPGEEPRRMQVYVFGMLRKLGFKVYVCESTEEAESIVRSHL